MNRTHNPALPRTRRPLMLVAALALAGCDPVVSIELPGPDLYPEGIAISSEGSLFVGSITTGTIFEITTSHYGSAVEEFSTGQLTRGALGMAVDDPHDVLLVCDSSPSEPSGSALVAIDLASGLAVATHPVPPAGAGQPVLCNDVTLDGAGTVYLSDSFGGRILRLTGGEVLADGVPASPWLTADSLAAISDPPFGANGIAEFEGELYAVNFNQGTLLRIPRDAAGAPLALVVVSLVDEDGAPRGLVGPDGIAASSDGHLLVVENGIFAAGDGNRLSAIALDGDTGVVSTIADGFDVPTTVAEGSHYTWVVEGQLDHLFGLDPAPPAPFTITGVRRE